MLELVCPNCERIFYRSGKLARTVTECPACHTRLTFNKEGVCKLIKSAKYTLPLLNLLRRQQLKPISKIALEIQKAVSKAKPLKVVPIGRLRGRSIWGEVRKGRIEMLPPKKIQQQLKHSVKWFKGEPFILNPVTGRKLLAHEIAHVAARIPEGWAGQHGPYFKAWRRQVEKVMKRTGATKKLKKFGYAREDPKHVRTYFNELKQHKVAFRTRMQWLSRIYGGRGGYTSEQLYKIVTGKTVSGYYIFPFVKGAPPEVNRILEKTYRTHREAGDTKTAAAIAAWTKVKQAGYVRIVKPSPRWVKRKKYCWLQPMRVIE